MTESQNEQNKVHAWLKAFAGAYAQSGSDVSDLFLPSGSWRDFLAFGWTMGTHEGQASIAYLTNESATTSITDIAVQAAPNANEGFFSFNTSTGPVEGYLRLEGGKCLTLFTKLRDLKDYPQAQGANRPTGVTPASDGKNWADIRDDEIANMGTHEQPYALIIGGGQAGLGLAATLRTLGVPNLVIDKHPKIGDQWRSRYKSLLLHDPVWYDHLPYMKFPENWPIYTPKDKMGDWLEFYAKAMELVTWTSSELINASYDDKTKTWTAIINKAGTEHTVKCSHLIMAVGNAGFARIPEFTGAKSFKGPSFHSSRYSGGAEYAGKRVAIVGANNSAHDIAADLVENGAQPTLIQRSSTLVLRQETMINVFMKSAYSHEALESGLTPEMADIMVASLPLRMSDEISKQIWAGIAQMDKEFYDSLRAKGFAIDFAEDGAGMGAKYLRAASGYYIDVGASAMVADGRIGVKSGLEIDAVTPDGLVFSDGSNLDVDVIIYATGFGSMEQWVSKLIGEDVANLIGPCWGYGSGFKGDPGPWEGELRNMWKPTAQEGLWFQGGNLAQVRANSLTLGLQIKARFEGLDVKIVEPLRA